MIFRLDNSMSYNSEKYAYKDYQVKIYHITNRTTHKQTQNEVDT